MILLDNPHGMNFPVHLSKFERFCQGNLQNNFATEFSLRNNCSNNFESSLVKFVELKAMFSAPTKGVKSAAGCRFCGKEFGDEKIFDKSLWEG